MDLENNEREIDDNKKNNILTKDIKNLIEEDDLEERKNQEQNRMYIEKIWVPTTIAGFITLCTGIAVLSKALWETSLLGELTWYVILFVGIFLIIIGIFAISRA